jgi:predicted O-linked N-acetylglucosamine transferase (SPINDLY family)
LHKRHAEGLDVEITKLKIPAALTKAIQLHQAGTLEEARRIYQAILDVEPRHAEVQNNLGVLLKSLRELPAAEARYRQAIILRPDYYDAHGNLGNLLLAAGRLFEAEAIYRHGLRINPHHAVAHYNLGNAFLAIQRLDDALTCFRQAIRLKPDHAGAYTDLGNTLKGMGRLSEAEAVHQQALLLNPHSPQAHNNLGIALADQGRLHEATSHFQRAIGLQPYIPEIHSNLLFYMNYMDGVSKETKLQEARHYGRRVAQAATKRFASWTAAMPLDRLRIGFISGDFRNHPVTYFLEGLLARIDRSRFELFAYTMNRVEDELTVKLRTHFDRWTEIFNKTDLEAAEGIHADGVHVLIDLAGHTAFNRLPVLAFKPAPVQASWLGYFATTGVSEVDYLLGDPQVSPVEDDPDFVERVKRLPETYLCWTPPHIELAVAELPALAKGHVTFGCFNNGTKLNEDVLSAWARVLNAVDGSMLFLKASQFADADFRNHIVSTLGVYGVSPDRLIIEGRSTRADYFEAYSRVDMALDPFPFPGGTISVDGLWMGVPVVTKRGDCFIARNGETIARNCGQDAWVARDDREYMEKAIGFASDIPALARLRRDLRPRLLASPLFDSTLFAGRFEQAMDEMWRDHHSGVAGSVAAGANRMN